MRILLIIVMVLAMLVATGLGLMVGNENLLSENAETASKLIEAAGDSGGEAIEALKGTKTSGMGGFLVGIAALVMVIVTFMKKTKVVQIMAGVTSLLAIIFIAMSPAFEMGENAGMDPRGQAMVYGIAGIIVALCGFGAEKMRTKDA